MSRHAYAQLGMTAAVSACLAAMIVVLGLFGARSLGVMTWHAPSTGDDHGAASLHFPAARAAAQPARNVAIPPVSTPSASVKRAPHAAAAHPRTHASRPRRAATHRAKRVRHASPKPRPTAAPPAPTPAPAVATAQAAPAQPA